MAAATPSSSPATRPVAVQFMRFSRGRCSAADRPPRVRRAAPPCGSVLAEGVLDGVLRVADAVLDVLACLLEPGLALLGPALGLQLLVAGHLADDLLGLAEGLVELVLGLVREAHDISPVLFGDGLSRRAAQATRATAGAAFSSASSPGRWTSLTVTLTSTTCRPVIRSTALTTLRRMAAARSAMAAPYSTTRSMSMAAWVSPTSTDTPWLTLVVAPGMRSRRAARARAAPAARAYTPVISRVARPAILETTTSPIWVRPAVGVTRSAEGFSVLARGAGVGTVVGALTLCLLLVDGRVGPGGPVRRRSPGTDTASA